MKKGEKLLIYIFIFLFSYLCVNNIIPIKLKSTCVNAEPLEYDREKALNYAKEFYNKTCSDGIDFLDYKVGDCAHYVSCCIGREKSFPGGGLDFGEKRQHNNYKCYYYGIIGAGLPLNGRINGSTPDEDCKKSLKRIEEYVYTNMSWSSWQLIPWLLEKGWIEEVNSIDNLEEGDIIHYSQAFGWCAEKNEKGELLLTLLEDKENNSKIDIGDVIKTNCHIRKTPSLKSSILQKNATLTGIIIEGPKEQDNCKWWKIKFDTSINKKNHVALYIGGKKISDHGEFIDDIKESNHGKSYTIFKIYDTFRFFHIKGNNSSSSPNEKDIPKFLTLPFKDPDIKIQQGWVYTTDTIPHKGIDYINGFIDRSTTWKSFDVAAAASGWAMWSNIPNIVGKPTYGNFVLIRHEEKDKSVNYYFTLYAHLESIAQGIPKQDIDNIDYNDHSKWKFVKQGEIIGKAGNTGATDTGIHLHFTVNIGRFNVQCTDPYDLREKRDFYPGGKKYKSCGSNHLWTTDPPSVKPQPPKNLSATAGDGYVELSWSPSSSSNLQGYRIYRGTSSGGESFCDAVPQTRTTYKNTNVNNGTTYYYYVTALDKNGNESEPSNRVSATPNRKEDDKLPDLQVTSYNVSSFSVQEGETLQVLVTVANKGEGTANPSKLALYLSPHDDWDINDDYFVKKEYVRKLLPNNSQEIIFSFPMPDLGSGTYNEWLIFVVDCDKEVKESDERNTYKGNKPLEIKDSISDKLQTPKTIKPTCGSTVNPGTVTFEWSSVSGATYYEFELYKGNNIVASKTYSNTTCSWTLGEGEDEYLCWRVRACNNSGCGQWSEFCCFTKKGKISHNTLPTITTKPATDITSTSAKLNAIVNPNGQETEVLFFYGTDPSNLINHTSFQRIGSGRADVNVSEIIKGLKLNTTYYFKAYAKCPLGGVDGDIKSFKTLERETPPDNKPQPPKNLSATAGDGYVELSWSPSSSSNLQGYRIYRGISSGGESFYDAVPQTRTTYKNTNVNNGTTYYYYVTALDKNGNESEPSNRVSATPNKSGGGNPPSDEKVKLTLYVHEGSSNGPTVAGASVSGYDAKNNNFSKTTNNNGYVEIEGVAGNWSFKVTKSGYKKNEWNEDIKSTCTKHAYIEKDSNSGGGNEKPQPPKNLKAEVIFDSSARKAGIRITWDASSSSSVTKYRMYRKEENGSYSSIGDRDSAYTTFRDWSITLGKKYYYKVTSINNFSESDYSNEANIIAGVLVNTNAKLNVRKGAGLSYDIIVTLPKGTYGLIMGGPTKADGYYWWYCYWNYNNNNYYGWSIEDGLDIYSGPLTIKEPIDFVTCFICANFRFPILCKKYLLNDNKQIHYQIGC